MARTSIFMGTLYEGVSDNLGEIEASIHCQALKKFTFLQVPFNIYRHYFSHHLSY